MISRTMSARGVVTISRMKVVATASIMSRIDPLAGGGPVIRPTSGTIAVRINSSNIDSLSLKCR